MSIAVLGAQSLGVLHNTSLNLPGREQYTEQDGSVGGQPKVPREILCASEQVRILPFAFAACLIPMSQLCHLASLHHQSEYSRIKFGPNGARLYHKYS